MSRYWRLLDGRRGIALLSVLILIIISTAIFADGTETLGPASIPIASGTDFVTAGTGLQTQPNTIDIDIPAGSAIQQVILYWSGRMDGNVLGDDTLTVNGNTVTGQLIGGPTLFYQGGYASAYRADITNLGLLSTGSNTVVVSGQEFTATNHGAGILVILDDGSGEKSIEVRDGIDISVTRVDGLRRDTFAQTFSFDPVPEACTAELASFFSGHTFSTDNLIEVTVDGVTTSFEQLIASRDGASWDTLQAPFPIPAGTDTITVYARAGIDFDTNFISKLTWNMLALRLDCEQGGDPLGSIGDRVWFDDNGDGIQGSGEAGIPDVQVILTDCMGSQLEFDTTDANGNYLFENYPADTYCVEIDPSSLPSGVTQTYDADGLGSPNESQLALGPGENNLDQDFGYQSPPPTYTLGDFYWYDQDQDGIQDPNEPGLDGVNVNLHDNASCSFSPIASTTTGPDGFYEFTGLPAGTYCVQFTGPFPIGAAIISPADQGGDDSVDSDLTPAFAIRNINLSADDPTNDGGLYSDGTLGDRVVCVTTGVGIANVGVSLFEDFNGDGMPDGAAIATIDTNSFGNYLFTGLEVALAGDPNNTTAYIVQVDTTDPDLGTCNVPESLTETNPELDTNNFEDLDNDFEFSEQPTYTLGDRIWYDQDQDGIQDPNEPGLNGVTINLFDNAFCSGPMPIATTTTAAGPMGFGDGFYEFTGLLAGTYCVTAGGPYPPGASLSPGNQGGDDTIDSDFDGAPLIRNINLSADDPTNDGGVYADGELGDQVVCISTGLGIPNISVSLFEDFDGNGAPDGAAIDTDTTDLGGFYNFNGLEVALAGDAGNTTAYIIQVDTTDPDLGTCNVPVSPTETNRELDTNDRIDLDNDFEFSEQPTYTLGDRIWYDQDQDGIQDPNEPGLDGVNVNLHDNASCSFSPIASTTTGPDGFYEFTGLPAGTYCVQFTGPFPIGAAIISPADQGGDDSVDSDLTPAFAIRNINLSADDPTNDGGLYSDGTLGDRVVCVTTGVGIANVGVSLFEDFNGDGMPDGAAIATIDTNSFGNYLFTGLEVALAGDPNNTTAYIVQVDTTDPDLGTCNVPESLTETNPELDTNNFEDLDNDFEFSEQPTYTLGDRIWYDQDQDGIQDPNEPGLNGVTINLFDNAFCSGPMPIATTTTAAGPMGFGDGFYEFTGLLAGTYCVTAGGPYPPGASLSPGNQGGDDTIDSDFDGAPLIRNINLSADDPTNDGGVYADGELGDQVVCISTGLGIPNISVSLFEDFDGNGAPDGAAIDTDTTDLGGFYNFNGLEVALAGDAGNTTAYIIQVDTTDPDLGTCNVPVSPTETNRELDTNDRIDLDNDFEFSEQPTYTLGDRIWYDQDQDGIQDPNEPGINGVVVNLYDNASCSFSPIATTTTGSSGPDGFYEFTGLLAGTYCVTAGGPYPPGVIEVSPANQGGDDSVDSDINNGFSILNINLSADDPTNDGGLYGMGRLGNKVVCVSTGLGIPNIGISLFEDFDGNGVADGPAIDSTSTDGSGNYRFSGLEVALAGDAGNTTAYIVQVDTSDPDLGTCSVPVSPTETNPEIDTSNREDLDNDFEFSEDATCPTATVIDGDYSEWDLVNDFFADMHVAGNETKPVLSRAYLRYDCTCTALSVLVLDKDLPGGNINDDGQTMAMEPDDAWVKIRSIANSNQVDLTATFNNNGVPIGVAPESSWVPSGGVEGSTLAGYEASFPLAPGSYEIEIHINTVAGDTSSTGKPPNEEVIELTCP